MTTKVKINYIPAFYYGERMNSSYSSQLKQTPLFMLDKQIEAIQQYGDGIDRVTFVFNLDNLNDGDTIQQYLKYKNLSFNYDVHCRANKGASYGAWDEVIKKNINDFDYFFVSEDDFVPATKKFYQPFIDRCKNNVAYVCMFANSNRPYKGVPHAAIPHGVLLGSACRKVLNNQNRLFKIYAPDNTYDTFYRIQMEYFEYFIDEGFVIGDILDEYSSPYMVSPTESVTIYGDPKNPVLVRPIPLPR